MMDWLSHLEHAFSLPSIIRNLFSQVQLLYSIVNRGRGSLARGGFEKPNKSCLGNHAAHAQREK